MKHPHVLEAGADVSKAADHRVVQFQEVKLWHDFACHLEVVVPAVDSQFDFGHDRQIVGVDAKSERKELFVEVNDVFDFFSLDDAEQLVLKVLHYDHALFGWLGNFHFLLRSLANYFLWGLFLDKLLLWPGCGYLRQILIGIQTVLPTARWHLIHRLHSSLLQFQ